MHMRRERGIAMRHCVCPNHFYKCYCFPHVTCTCTCTCDMHMYMCISAHEKLA